MRRLGLAHQAIDSTSSLPESSWESPRVGKPFPTSIGKGGSTGKQATAAVTVVGSNNNFAIMAVDPGEDTRTIVVTTAAVKSNVLKSISGGNTQYFSENTNGVYAVGIEPATATNAFTLTVVGGTVDAALEISRSGRTVTVQLEVVSGSIVTTIQELVDALNNNAASSEVFFCRLLASKSDGAVAAAAASNTSVAAAWPSDVSHVVYLDTNTSGVVTTTALRLAKFLSKLPGITGTATEGTQLGVIADATNYTVTLSGGEAGYGTLQSVIDFVKADSQTKFVTSQSHARLSQKGLQPKTKRKGSLVSPNVTDDDHKILKAPGAAYRLQGHLE